MEGLEINIRNLNEIQNNVDNTFRIDAEHYQRKYQKALSVIQGINYTRLKNLIRQPISTGHTPSMQVDRFYNGNIKFIKTDNLRENQITDDFTDYLTEEGAKELSKTNLQVDDVITTIIGATHEIVGRTAILREENLPANINQNIALIRVNKELILPKFLNIYLNTKLGRLMLHYHSRQTEQVNLNCREVERVLVPIFSFEFQKKISDLVEQAYQYADTAKIHYDKAESLLTENLGLTNFQIVCNPINIKSLKESFLQTGRLDAEYYQPIYELLENYIFSHSNGFEKLGNICRLNDENYTPRDSQEYDYIELSNIGKSGEITGSTRALGKELPSRARRKVRSNQVMISSIEGSLQSCAIVPPHYDNALCSTGFYVLSSDQINAETLLVLFKSSLMQQILKKNCSGTILTAINKEELLNIPLPIIDEKIQIQIANYIQQSNGLREQAKTLLAQAKSNVEWEIENVSLNINGLQDCRGGKSC